MKSGIIGIAMSFIRSRLRRLAACDTKSKSSPDWTRRGNVILLIALVMNLALPSGWYQQALADDPPPPSPELQSYLDIQEQVSQTLFGHSYDSTHFAFILSQQVAGVGTVQGTNSIGEPFTLDVIVHNPISLADLTGVPAATLAAAIAQQLQPAGVVARMTTSQGSVAVTGTALSGLDASGVMVHRFMVMTLHDLAGALFTPPAVLPPEQVPYPSIPGFNPLDPPGVPVISTTRFEQRLATAAARVAQWNVNKTQVELDCSDHCLADYGVAIAEAQAAYADAVEDAWDAYNDAVAAAEATRDAALAACWNTYYNTVQSAGNSLALALSLCTAVFTGLMFGCGVGGGFFIVFTFGIGLAVCIATAHAAFAACSYTAIDNYNTTVALAQGVYAGCTGLANTAYQLAVLTAQMARTNALNAAATARDQAIEDAEDTLDECLDGCDNMP